MNLKYLEEKNQFRRDFVYTGILTLRIIEHGHIQFSKNLRQVIIFS